MSQPMTSPDQHQYSSPPPQQHPQASYPPPPQGTPPVGQPQQFSPPPNQQGQQYQQPQYQQQPQQQQYQQQPQQQQQYQAYQQPQHPQQQQQQQYAPYQQHSTSPPPPQQQYGYQIPGFTMPHIPGLSHFGGHSANTGGFQTAPSAPAAKPTDAAHAATSNDPGTIHEVMGNGTTIRKHADGHKSTQHPDGTIVHTYHDGSTKTINRDGTESFYTPTVAKADYVDKAFAMGSKHLGLHLSRNTQEKITDKGRGMFEKFTGKKVPTKWSN